MEPIAIHYFTGTGNTEHAVRLILNQLKQKEYQPFIQKVKKGILPPEGNYSTHLFAFPVYGFSAPQLFIDYIKKMKPQNSSKAAILAINGATTINGKVINGYSGCAVQHIEALLKKKNFIVQLSENLSYPENWTQLFNPATEEDQKKIFTTTDQKVQDFTNKIINQQTGHFTIGWKYYGMLPLKYLFTLFARRILGKIYIADHHCNNCGLCVKTCPVQTIRLWRKKPIWGADCQACNRCINLCPQKAIQTSILKILIHGPLIIWISILFLIKVIEYTAKLFQLTYTALILPTQIFLSIISIILIVLTEITLVDYIIRILERIPLISKLFKLNYTKRFRRYHAPNYSIDE